MPLTEQTTAKELIEQVVSGRPARTVVSEISTDEDEYNFKDKVKLKIDKNGKFRGRGRVIKNDEKQINASLEGQVDKKDLKTLDDDLQRMHKVSLKDVDLTADFGFSGDYYYAPAGSKKVPIDSELEVYIKHKGKELDMGMWPPALAFKATLKV